MILGLFPIYFGILDLFKSSTFRAKLLNLGGIAIGSLLSWAILTNDLVYPYLRTSFLFLTAFVIMILVNFSLYTEARLVLAVIQDEKHPKRDK